MLNLSNFDQNCARNSTSSCVFSFSNFSNSRNLFRTRVCIVLCYRSSPDFCVVWNQKKPLISSDLPVLRKFLIKWMASSGLSWLLFGRCRTEVGLIGLTSFI